MTRGGVGARIGRTAGGLASSLRRHRRTTRHDKRRSRGTAELSVVVVAGSLVAGVLFGQGLSNTAVDLADGLTWLSDSPSGEVIQVNPATGALEVRQSIGNPGDDIAVAAQYDGHMFVIDHTTGQLMSFDLTSILVSGQRQISSGGSVETLVHDGHVFLVDPERATISSIDPVRTDAIGTIWVAPAGLADAAIDADGTVWAIEDDGTLHGLKWSDKRQEFQERDTVEVARSGPGSVLVAHDRGVTVFGPDEGVVAQVGSSTPMQLGSDQLSGTVLAPETSPSDLVPAAAPDTSTVVILSPAGIREVAMGLIGCSDPGTPEVFRDRVYVPCRGAGKVVQLSAEGAKVGEDILTPGADDPELMLDDDNLIINAPGADHGVVVHGDGTSGTIVRQDVDIPLTSPGTTSAPPAPPAPPAPTSQAAPDQQLPGGTNGGKGNHHPTPATPTPTTPTPTTTPTTGPGGGTGGTPGGNPGGGTGGRGDGGDDGADPLSAPTNVVATALPEGQVKVTWAFSDFRDPQAFTIRSTDQVELAQVSPAASQAIVNVTPGEPTAFTVTAILEDEEATSDPSNAVTTTARPGAPTVSGTASYQGDGAVERFVVELTWTEPAANGEPILGYDVSVNVGGVSKSSHTGPGTRSISFTWTCDRAANPACQVGGDFTATVTANNVLGRGEPGVLYAVAPTQPPPPLPAADGQLVRSSSPSAVTATADGDGQISLRLNPAADWARFPGECAAVLDDVSTALACNAVALTLPFANGPLYPPSEGTVDHTVRFTATNPSGVATSAAYSFTSTQPVVDPHGGGTHACPTSPAPCRAGH